MPISKEEFDRGYTFEDEVKHIKLLRAASKEMRLNLSETDLAELTNTYLSLENEERLKLVKKPLTYLDKKLMILIEQIIDDIKEFESTEDVIKYLETGQSVFLSMHSLILFMTEAEEVATTFGKEINSAKGVEDKVKAFKEAMGKLTDLATDIIVK